jgi:hypothetical protein
MKILRKKYFGDLPVSARIYASSGRSTIMSMLHLHDCRSKCLFGRIIIDEEDCFELYDMDLDEATDKITALMTLRR